MNLRSTAYLPCIPSLLHPQVCSWEAPFNAKVALRFHSTVRYYSLIAVPSPAQLFLSCGHIASRSELADREVSILTMCRGMTSCPALLVESEFVTGVYVSVERKWIAYDRIGWISVGAGWAKMLPRAKEMEGKSCGELAKRSFGTLPVPSQYGQNHSSRVRSTILV